MNLFHILSNSRRTLSGAERVILRNLPMALLGGTLIPAFVSALNHAFPPDGPPLMVARHLTSVDIFAIASVLTVWMTVLTAAIVCVTVVLMKGPAYVADAYPISESERPDAARDRRRM
jgi:hypothetical protein